MEIIELEYVVPTKELPIGSVTLHVKVPFAFSELEKPLTPSEQSVELSEATMVLIRQACLSAVKDIETKA